MTDLLDERALEPGRPLILGAGLAGLFLALRLAPRRPLVIAPQRLGAASATAWAQGGLAAAMAPEDSAEAHAADTIAAGAGLVDPAIALMLAEEGPARVRDLVALGVPFDRSADGALAQSLEAAHSRPRVVRVKGDLAGQAILAALIAAAKADPRIEILEGPSAEALRLDGQAICRGAVLRVGTARRLAIAADETILATGGVGGLYRVTTNPRSALGQGVAMAWLAGALIADPEFVQFHPTAIDIGRDPAPLATEALRGEGARLVNAAGEGFMARLHPEGDLAPRDAVARGVAAQIAAAGSAFLDARDAIGAHFPEAFPSVFAACMSAGLDPRRDLIPIAPAAHYHMGGIVTDNWGKASLPGLSAVGECASTGAHGANRLASNSLLEAVAFAERIAQRLLEDAMMGARGGLGPAPGPVPELPGAELEALRALMSAKVGVVREERGLRAAVDAIAAIEARCGPADAVVVAGLIAQAALDRRESRGAHCRSDYPQAMEPATRSFRQAAQRRMAEAII